MATYFNFIDGVLSKRAQNLLTQFSPHTGTENFQFSQSDFMDVVSTVKAAHLAQKKWQALNRSERLIILKRFGELIAQNIEEFAKLECEDSGIPMDRAVELCSEASKHFFEILRFRPELTSQSILTGAGPGIGPRNCQDFQVTSPVGLIGLITDWQQSFTVLLENIAVSLICENLLVIYPSEFGARSALKLAELATQANVIPGVLNVLLGRGDELALHLVEHPGVKYLRFYGENTLGDKLAMLAAENHKRLELVLGVNNSAIVFADAHVEVVSPLIFDLVSQFHFYGRSRVNRILIQEKLLSSFKTSFLKEFDMKKSALGPLPSQLFKIKFIEYLAQSNKDRAKVLATGDLSWVAESSFVPLTLYEDLTNCSTLHQNDLSGPICFLQSFKYAADLSKILGSGSYASTAYVFTNDILRIQRLADQLEVSQIYFNSGPKIENLTRRHIRQSGVGNSGVAALFEFNLNRKGVHVGVL